VAAVHYLLGERFDADPFLIFELRGRSKEAIIEALRARRAGALPVEDEAAPEQMGDEEEEAVAPLAESLDNFWSAPEDALEMAMDFSSAQVDALPVKRLGAPPFWRGQPEFMDLMARAYQAIAAHAHRLAMGDD
jgi:uncharacterized Zn finger protein